MRKNLKFDIDKLDEILHIVTERDLGLNPDWVLCGIKPGDEITVKKNKQKRKVWRTHKKY